MVSLSQVTKRFENDHLAVDSLSLTVKEGETMVLLGTSGCGKTTTLRMINRLIQPDAGEIHIHNKPISAIPPAELRKGIGYVMQQPGLFPHYTIEQNIGIVPTLLGWKSKDIQQRVHTLMNQLHLPVANYAHKYAHELSGGQQQRVGLARAMAGNPSILLMDEPFGALDPATRLHVRNDFMELEASTKKTIIMVTHDMEEAFCMGNRICLMHEGKIVQLGTPAELLFAPANDFVRSFFDSHRTLLEWQVIPLKNIEKWLPLQTDNEQDNIPVISSSDSCWKALEWLTQGQEKLLIKTGNNCCVVDKTHIIDAIHHFKTEYKTTHG
ncbi:osmoprotectant transport system ATP-binding protein [Filimonas lacunae]|uniref:Osmoprotectant transport system ATP-binding protein n=1 Tax=Filimonas lacunae TaxID=477680 RepID=A0A173MFK9_9BACT|nr:ATP-binding cassette domain-containing protein [Filimonas lacunae]BAV06365.1 L-proline glycine betaine ABC transport system permease protein ProV [Filimonas lacunae]SIT26639.1 osmoprotectant transport system ATP-binding protein [Filimonas lacunae]